MGARQSSGSHVLALIAALSLAGCDQKAGGTSDPAKPQAVLSSAESGGRVPAGSASPAAASTPAATNAATTEIDFGDDASKFARDGECDDKRFSGEGMTNTPLLESDVRHDATDCRTAFRQGRLKLGPSAAPQAQGGYADSGVDHIIWGDDASQFSKDGECDDKRFTGSGMTNTPLLDSDIKHDATDCRAAYAQGRLKLSE